MSRIRDTVFQPVRGASMKQTTDSQAPVMDIRPSIPLSFEFLTHSQIPPLPAADVGTPLSQVVAPAGDLHLQWLCRNLSDFHPNHLRRICLLPEGESKVVRRFADDAIPLGWPETEHRFRTEVVLNYEQILLDEAAVDGMVRAWLYDRGVRFGRRVFLLMDRGQHVLQMPWRMIVRYWRIFARHCGFASVVVDGTKGWALCLHHEGFLLFGTRS